MELTNDQAQNILLQTHYTKAQFLEEDSNAGEGEKESKLDDKVDGLLYW